MADDEGYDADISSELSKSKFWISPRNIDILDRHSKGENSEINFGRYQNMEVALKILPGSTLVDAERERFNRQVKILKRANHKNIVKFIGASVDDDSTMIIVLELIPGYVTLEHYLRGVTCPDHEVMTLEIALTMGIAISEAMEFLHNQGIMHCNLKLSNVMCNILITEEGEAKLSTLKLTGFSNAREVIVDEEEDIEHVIEGLAMRAIAKTQYKQKNGFRQDVYCFGQVFYKILKDITRTDPEKRMNSTGPLYLSSSEEEYHGMEDIPEQMVEFLTYCFEGQSSFQLLNQSLDTILEHLQNEQQSNKLTTTPVNSVPSSGGLEDGKVIDPRGILQGASIATTPSAIFCEAMYQTRHVLVQVFQPDERQHVKLARRLEFDRKVLLLSRLEHPNIVQFIGSCVEPSLIIVTEFMEGGTLETYLHDLGTDTPPIRTALNFALGISRAMQHLHSKGIIHRDLKSSNVFLSRDIDLIKLGGFGNVRKEKDLIREMSMDNKASSSHEIMQHKYGRKADVFNFSRILYELLTNKPTEFEEYVSPSGEIRPTLDHIVLDELVQLLESCASEDEEDRLEFEEISNMLADLLQRNPREVQQDEWVAVREFLLRQKNEEDETDSSELERLRKELKEKRRKENRKKVMNKVLSWFGHPRSR